MSAADRGVPGEAGSAAAGCPAGANCYDFEKDTAGQKPGAPWTSGAGMITVDTTRAWSGKQAVRVRATSGTEGAFISSREGFPKANNEYFGRVMMWAETIPGGSTHWTFVQSGFGPVAGKTYSAIYNFGAEGNHIIANYDTQGAASDCWKFGSRIQVKKWVCVEWHFKGQPANQLELWMDGVADAASVNNGRGEGCIGNGTGGTWFAPTFPDVDIGYEGFSGNAPVELWYDDVAIGSERIGCPGK